MAITTRVEFDASKVLSTIKDGIVNGNIEMSNNISQQSANECPNDTGEMRKSLFENVDKEGFIVGYNKDYAPMVHENVNANFQRGKKAKFLEDPLKAHQGDYASILNNNIDI